MAHKQKDDKERARPPAFQFYCRDFLTSEKVQALTDRAFRAYVNLLAQAWLSTPVGTLPSDDRKLASMSRITRQAWGACKNEVLDCFEPDGERFMAPRLVSQYRALMAHSMSRAAAGRRGGAERWKTTDTQSAGDGKTDGKPVAKNGSASAFASAHTDKGHDVPLDGKTTTKTPTFDRSSPGVRRGTAGWYKDGWMVECDTCGPINDEHTRCHYCGHIYDITKGQNDGNHCCKTS